MIMDLEFKSLKELYERIKPALISKRSELRKFGYSHVKEADIWNYLTQTKWKTSSSLSLSEMVNDILNANSDSINSFVLKKVSEEIREPRFDD